VFTTVRHLYLSQIGKPVHALPSTSFTTYIHWIILYIFDNGFTQVLSLCLLRSFRLSMEKFVINIRDVTHFHFPSNLRFWFSKRFLSFKFPHKVMHALLFFPMRAIFSACFVYLCNKHIWRRYGNVCLCYSFVWYFRVFRVNTAQFVNEKGWLKCILHRGKLYLCMGWCSHRVVTK
jgi:hypothetical protein